MHANRLGLLAMASLFPLPGCATLATQLGPPSSQARLEVPQAQAWEAIHDVLERTPIRSENQAQGVIRTNWVEGWGDRRFGLLGGSWRRRYRLTIWIEPIGDKSLVKIRTDVEEKAPGAATAFRWRRVRSDGSIEADFLNRLQAQVTSLNG